MLTTSEVVDLSSILRNVKGTNRRQMIADFWDQDRFSELDPTLLADSPSPEMRRLDDPYRLWNQPDDGLPVPEVREKVIRPKKKRPSRAGA